MRKGSFLDLEGTLSGADDVAPGAVCRPAILIEGEDWPGWNFGSRGTELVDGSQAVGTCLPVTSHGHIAGGDFDDARALGEGASPLERLLRSAGLLLGGDGRRLQGWPWGGPESRG